MRLIMSLNYLRCTKKQPDNYLNNTPQTQNEVNRDRFILSKGHCCSLYYAILAEMAPRDEKESAIVLADLVMKK